MTKGNVIRNKNFITDNILPWGSQLITVNVGANQSWNIRLWLDFPNYRLSWKLKKMRDLG